MQRNYLLITRDLLESMVPVGEAHRVSDEEVFSCLLVALRFLDEGLFHGDAERRERSLRLAAEVLASANAVDEMSHADHAGHDQCAELLNLN